MTPTHFNHFHHISIIFQIFALKTDGELIAEEKRTIQTLLNEWIDDSATTKEILIESSNFLAYYDENHSDQITDLLGYSASEIQNSGYFGPDQLKSILADLVDIALSDSDEMSENESAFIAYLQSIWGV
jgi:hypothetical protein